MILFSNGVKRPFKRLSKYAFVWAWLANAAAAVKDVQPETLIKQNGRVGKAQRRHIITTEPPIIFAQAFNEFRIQQFLDFVLVSDRILDELASCAAQNKPRLGQGVAGANRVKRTIPIYDSINVLGNKAQRHNWRVNFLNLLPKTEVSLVGAVGNDPKIINVGRQHPCELLLPGFCVSYLIAVGKGIAECGH